MPPTLGSLARDLDRIDFYPLLYPKNCAIRDGHLSCVLQIRDRN